VKENCLSIGLVYDDSLDQYGGIPLYVTTLGRALIRRGHRVDLLVGDSAAANIGGATVHVLARNINVRFNGNALSMPIWSRAANLRRALEAGRYDVLHVQVPYSPLMAGRLLRRAAPHTAVVGTYHVASDRLMPRAGARLLRILKLPSASRFDEIISVSQTASDFAASCSLVEARRIVPNLLDLARRPSSPFGVRDQEADIVFVGRLVNRKGAKTLIDAIARIESRRPTLAIVGDGPLRPQLERHVRRTGLARHITFLGAVNDRHKTALLSQAKIACFPSLFGESFGLVILEALAAGTEAVLAGDNPGYRELLGSVGGLIDPKRTEAFAAELMQLLNDQDERITLGARQRGLLRRFDAELVVDEILDVYREVLARRPQRVPERPRRNLELAA
jgi:phosphatidyl-myo-inositol alpha-mannosyltransferase